MGIYNKQEAINYINGLKDDVMIEVKTKTKKTIRSTAQVRYYFGVIVEIISDFHGYTPIETHNLLKVTFDLKTTTGLSTSEFKYMCEMIIEMWTNNYQVKIPLPIDSGLEKSLMESLEF